MLLTLHRSPSARSYSCAYASNPPVYCPSDSSGLRHSVSDGASSSHQYPLNSPGFSIPDHTAVRGAASSDHHSSIDENDIVIAYVILELRFIALINLPTRVMGLTGVGKSSVSHWCKTLHPIRLRHSQFINTAAARLKVVVGNNLKSRAQAVQPIRCLHPDGRRNIVLLDTPGFDDTFMSDAQILGIIAHWLKET